MKKSRRSFFKNISLAGLSLGVAPIVARPASSHSNTTSGDCLATTLDFYGQGPFYTPGAPMLPDGMLAESTETGTRIAISGRVMTLDCSGSIPETVIDVWHADDAGNYDNVGFNLRGIVESNAQGFYMFETVLPGKYNNGPTPRPRHIHFKITPPGFPALITQLYFEGDTSIPADPAASMTSGTFDARERIIPLTENSEGVMEGTWDIMIDGEGMSSVQNAHLEHGMIYSVGPNPFTQEVEVSYGLYNRSRVALKVYDTTGRFIAGIAERQLPAEKYTATWRPTSDMPAGHYFIVLHVNDLQVHYQKVVYRP